VRGSIQKRTLLRAADHNVRPRGLLQELKGEEYVLTSKHLRALEVLVRVQVAGRKGEIKPDEENKQIRASPHGG
jgi:hypothetical protein